MYVCMYVCMYIVWMDVCMDITYSKSKDQPGKVANPACGQPKRGDEYFPVAVRAGDFDLAIQVWSPFLASACSFSHPR